MPGFAQTVCALTSVLSLIQSEGLRAAQTQSPSWAQGRPVLTCELCRLEGQEAVLCRPHLDEETATLAEWVPRLSQPDPEQRGDALEAIASLTLAHSNAPSRRVASVLTSVLTSDEPGLALVALLVLQTSGQHSDETVVGIASALESTASYWSSYRQALVSSQSDQGHSDRSKNELLALLTLPQWTSQLIEVARDYRDDRCIDGLCGLLGNDPGRLPDKLARETVAAILQHPTRRGIKHVVEYRAVLLKRLREGPIPGVLQGNGSPTPAQFVVATAARDLAAQTEFTLQAIDEDLARCAKALKLRAPSPLQAKFFKSDTGSILAWSRWYEKNDEQFPSALGTVGALVSADR